MKAISVLGSTGSIGTQTLDIARDFPDQYKVVALTAGRNLALLVEQIQEHRPEVVALADTALLGTGSASKLQVLMRQRHPSWWVALMD